MALCSRCLRSLLPIQRTVLCRSYGREAVSSYFYRDWEEKFEEPNPKDPVYYGANFRFNILCTQGLETSKDASDLLKKRISPERVEILSSGELLIPASDVMSRLNHVFGQANWVLTPVSDMGMNCRVDFALSPAVEYALFINRQFVSQAVGHSKTPLTAVGRTGLRYRSHLTPEFRQKISEEAKYVALQRCARELMIGNYLMSKEYGNFWRKEYAEEVEEVSRGLTKKVWRRKEKNE